MSAYAVEVLMTIRGVTFDLDGTIVDLEHIHFDGFVHSALEFGISLDFEAIISKIPGAIGGGDQRIAEGIARLGTGLDAVLIKERKKYHYNRLLHELAIIEPRPGFLDVFHELRKSGLKVAIGSSTPRHQGLRIMEKSLIAGLFPSDCLVFAENVKNLKPAPDIYLETARRMQIDPREQLVFEDSAVGISAAVAAGSIGIGIPVFHYIWLVNQIHDAGVASTFFHWHEINVPLLLEALGG